MKKAQAKVLDELWRARKADLPLKTKDDAVVLGPSDDGGYYLIGLRKLHRSLFEEIDWSTERVLAQTIDRARRLGLRVHLLPAWYDVDTADDLRRLTQELQAASAGPPVHTRQFLAAEAHTWLAAGA